MAKVKIELDGRVLRTDEYSFASISVSKSIEPQKDITQDIVFYKGAYDQIKTALIDPQFGYLESLPIRIFDTCCSDSSTLIFDGKVEGKSLEYCDNDCYVQTTAVATEPLLDCLKGQILSQGLNDIRHPNILAFEDRSDFEAIVISLFQSVSDILLVLVVAVLTPILSFLTIVEAVIQGIDALLDALRTVPILKNIIPDIIPSGDRDFLPDLSDLGDTVRALQGLVDKLNNYSYYPAPRVRTMLQNACNKCAERTGANYDFVSSIFTDSNSDYYNTTWFKPDGKGFAQQTDLGLSDNNKPLITAESLLDDLSAVFNARWWVENNTLRFEPKNNFRGSVDYSSKKTCFTLAEEDLPARAEIIYQRDAIDIAGNISTPDFDYLIEFASDGTSQRGKKDYQLPFSVPNITLASKNELNTNLLTISRGGSSSPKLVIFDNDSQITDQTPLKGEELWRRFFNETENPNLDTFKPRRFDINTVYECGQEVPSPGGEILLQTGSGIVEGIDIDYSSRQITITGKA